MASSLRIDIPLLIDVRVHSPGIIIALLHELLHLILGHLIGLALDVAQLGRRCSKAGGLPSSLSLEVAPHMWEGETRALNRLGTLHELSEPLELQAD